MDDTADRESSLDRVGPEDSKLVASFLSNHIEVGDRGLPAAVKSSGFRASPWSPHLSYLAPRTEERTAATGLPGQYGPLVGGRY